MFYDEYINKMKDIQNKLIKFIDIDDDIEEHYQNLIGTISSSNILDNHHEIKSFLYLISKIAKYHHKTPNMYDKIKQILLVLKKDLRIKFSNLDIFSIFKGNKTILLYLIQEKIIIMNMDIFNEIQKNQSSTAQVFFKPEIDQFIKKQDVLYNNCKNKPKETMKERQIEEFNEKRNIGENDNIICKLIREDLIEEFIIYMERFNCSVDSYVEESIFETNPLLCKNQGKVNLIEYATFFGAVQVFKFLYKNGAELNQSLWIYAIHGNHPEIICILEEKKIIPDKELLLKCYIEAIKCHHIDMANYIQHNYKKLVDLEKNLSLYYFQYYNYFYFPKELNIDMFNYACTYDHYIIVQHYLMTKKVKIDNFSILIYIINEIIFTFHIILNNVLFVF